MIKKIVLKSSLPWFIIVLCMDAFIFSHIHMMRVTQYMFVRHLTLYSLASVFSNGTSFCVSIMFPVILSFPFINASCGFSLPRAMSTKSSSDTVSVVSTLTLFSAGPSYNFKFFKSMAKIENHYKNINNKNIYLYAVCLSMKIMKLI